MRSELVVLCAALACGRVDDEGEGTAMVLLDASPAAIDLAQRVRAGDPEVGAAACAVVRERPIDPRMPIPELVTTAYAVIAVTGTNCPELASALVDVACDPRLDCGKGRARGLCSPEELRPEVDRVLSELATSYKFPTGVEDRHLLLAAGHVQPSLPGRVRKQSARRRYTVVQPEAPRCADAAAGTPCKCLETPVQIDEASCASTHSDEHDTNAGCRLRVDDERHEIVVLRRSSGA
jgi:hypothetical protein